MGMFTDRQTLFNSRASDPAWICENLIWAVPSWMRTRVVLVQWGCVGVGYGEFTAYKDKDKDDDRWQFDTENMGGIFCSTVLEQACKKSFKRKTKNRRWIKRMAAYKTWQKEILQDLLTFETK